MADEESILNKYGDAPVATTGVHGCDITSQRIDELDIEALRFAIGGEPPTPIALDLGCGLGIQGMRFALLGMEVHLYDLFDIYDRISAFNAIFPLLDLHFHKVDLRQEICSHLPARVELAFSQRFVHYLRYKEACRLLTTIFDSMLSGGRVFLSASGLNSELGDGYLAKNQSLKNRFGPLQPAMSEKHQIHESVCLYTEGDLRKLTTGRGFEEIRIWSSSFGNVKGIFIKP
jgi:hypothetical protein